MKHYYGALYKGEITEYSPFFDTEKQRNEWYKAKGEKLEKMLGRKLLKVVKK